MQWGVNDSTKPWVVWRVIDKWRIEDIRTANDQMELIIPEAANRFSHGPPLYDATTPMMKPVDIDVI